MNLFSRFGLAVLCLGALVISSSPTQAALWKFDVLLDGLQEVPPNASPGYGDAVVFLDDVTRLVDVTGNFDSLIGTTTASHIHGSAPPGANAGVIVPLTIDLGVTSGTISVSGGGPLSPAQVTDALNGLTYINVHTTFLPGGEIRGQLLNPVQVPEPISATLLGIASIGLLCRRRR